MSPLDEYRRKRDFSKSPEPPGADDLVTQPPRRPLYFCVQKHLASHLHYDLRLEHNGVLLSWAVPKGPSLDSKTKRLAMQVEDHPVEYGSFEGIIPEGYGAGIVMLWDSGTWTPEVDDVDKALAKGDLKFTLDGYKLKGSWVLVRTRGYARRGERPDSRSEGRSWLLIKHRDDWSGDLDITEFAPLSVKTERDLPEILADDDPAVWRSGKAGSGETGALLRTVIEEAARIKASRDGERAESAGPAAPPKKTAKASARRGTPTPRRGAAPGRVGRTSAAKKRPR